MNMRKDFNEINIKFSGFANLVGNTPMLCVNFTYRGENRKIYAKAENFNLTGSIKDRMAVHILKKAYEREALKPGQVIIEATSGNTGISFSALGRALGHKVAIFMPDWMSQERKDLIRSLGADIHLVSREEGGFLGSISRAETLAKEINGFLPEQFANHDNSEAHYTTTGPEIWHQLLFRGLKPDAFVAGVGTGGTIMGVGAYLKMKNRDIIIRPMEPSNSPTLTTGYKVGKHRIQGISDEFIPAVLDLKSLDPVIDVDDGDAIIMAQKLSNQLGLGLGISSGANFLAALKIQNELGADSTVVTIFCDDNKKYLSTDLLKEEPIKEEFLSTDVTLDYYTAFKRVCATCCTPSECLELTTFDHIDKSAMTFCPLTR
jgi:cysteine synthase A